MSSFPPASDLQFLIGAELTSIWVAQWQHSFHFEGAQLAVECPYEHIDKLGNVYRHNSDEEHLAPLRVHHLLTQKVVTLVVENNCLTLTFDQGDNLRILRQDHGFENGQIYHAENMIAVF